eukprot:COSAG05_NODE_2654_length_2799_cov_1.955556_2_plen_388_part_00
MLVLGLGTSAVYLYMSGLGGPDRVHCKTLATLMQRAEMAWSSADATLDRCAAPQGSMEHALRGRGETTMNQNPGPHHTVEAWSHLLKMGHFLVGPEGDVNLEEVRAALPTIPEMIRDAHVHTNLSITNAMNGFSNTFLFAAAACEKLHMHAEMLEYACAGDNPDLTQGGTTLPTNVAMLKLLKGRACAALGNAADAAHEFEAVVELSRQYGYWLFEMYALRDLKLLVLDKTGQGEHGARRLGVALRQLVGPAARLTPLLQGLDAAQLMALPPPGQPGADAEEGVPPEGAVAQAAVTGSSGDGRSLALLVTSSLFNGKRKCVASQVSTVRELLVCITDQIHASVEGLPAASELCVVVRDDDFDEDVVVTDLHQLGGNTARVALERVGV